MNRKDNKIIDILRKEILCNGALSIADYMKICLTHPEHGYYIRNKPIGATGDFTTSPEISQMFGELIGLWIGHVWIDQQKPKNFSLVELGPGNGTLMADILRATKRISGFHSALNLILIEISPSLRKIQKNSLKGFSAQWKTDLETLPKQPTIVIANEFFDTLPVRQFKRNSDQWYEIMVNMEASDDPESNDFCYQLMKTRDKIFFNSEDRRIGDGCIIEISKSIQDIVRYLSKHIEENSGAALIIDYGKEGNLGNTLQAVHQHRYADPLRFPGEQDLTCLVDFEAIRNYAERSGVVVSNLICQGDFLKALGIEERARVLSQNLRGKALSLHQSALERLTSKKLMGNLFKVIGIRSEISPPLLGLEF